MKLKITLAQSIYNPLKTEAILRIVKKAKGNIICFPELFATGETLEKTKEYLSKVDERKEIILSEFKKSSRQYGKTIILPLVEKEGKKFYNSVFVISKGKILGVHRRIIIHPSEKGIITPGKNLKTFKVGKKKIKIGVLICYESAFPELARELSLKGIQILFVPASVPTGSNYLKIPRLEARAVDNQIFVVFVNRVGKIGNKIYTGKSMIASPKGRTIAKIPGKKEKILTSSIDLSEIASERKSEPVFSRIKSVLKSINKLKRKTKKALEKKGK